MRLIVVSGLSGAGKSVAMHALEDLGYYCIDNLPVNLLPAFAEELSKGEQPLHKRAAVSIDARNPAASLHDLPEIIQTLRTDAIVSDFLFIEADDDILIKRFSETRRKHPLTTDQISLAEAIGREREVLSPLRRCADICIDTSRTNLHQLRDLMRQRVDRRPTQRLSLLFESFGFKHGIPTDADMVFDVRCLPNPYWNPELRSLTGRAPEVANFLSAQPEVKDMYQHLETFLARWLPEFEADNRAYMTIAIGCTGGQHRSVYLAERLAKHFGNAPAEVLVRHRELS